VPATQSPGVNTGSPEKAAGPGNAGAASSAARSSSLRDLRLSQERIVLAIAAILFVGFSVFTPGFLSAGNVLSLIQNVSILGILGVGMAQAIIGRGIDLSMVATMAMSVAWTLDLMHRGATPGLALLAGLAMAIVIGLINGFLIAYIEIPAIFATLAMATVVYGFGQNFLVPTDITYMSPSASWLKALGGSSAVGVPSPIIVFAALCLIAYLFLRFTKWGRFIYSMGDNPLTARVTGIPTRPMMLLQYALAGLVAYLAGLVTAAVVNSMSTRVVNSTLVYDVILVVVIGGIGLSGGKGGVRNVIVGTLLIGILLNGMTILDMPYTAQNIVKGLILLGAIVVDSILNPRDEQTAQQGDI
jgi:ribose transport system permease protein